MAAQLFTLPQQVRVSSSGAPYALAKAYFYRVSTTTDQAVYTTPALSVAHAQPVQADAAGQFPAIWLDAAATYDYRVIVKTSSGATLDDYTIARTRVSASQIDLTASDVGAILYPRTSAEIAAGVTPTNYYIASSDSCGEVRIERYGAAGTSLTDSAAIRSAISVASVGWLPVRLPARRMYYDGTAITTDKVKIWGSGMPRVNSGKTALVGGSIVEGCLTFSGSYIDLRNFGVDLGTLGSATDNNGIKCTAATYNAGEHIHTENLVALCKNKTSAFHALLFEGYQKHTGGNLHGVYGYFGCVIKNRGVQLTTIHTRENNETGVYLKSDSTYGTCSDIQIGSIRTEAATQFGMRVQSDSDSLKSVQIGRIHGSDHQRTICIQILSPNGIETTNIECGDVLSERASIADFSVLSQDSGHAGFNVGANSLIAIDPTAQVVEATCDPGCSLNALRIGRLYASYPSGTSQATMDNAVAIGSGVNSSDLGRVEIVEAYGVGTKIGSINYTNSAVVGANILGSHRCKVIGSGRPQPGTLAQTLTGTTATLLIPENTSGDGVSLAYVTIAAGVTVTTFAPENTGSTFPLGHTLIIHNNSTFNLQINHSPGTGIINTGAANFVIAGSEMAAWVHIASGIWSKLR